jgi:glyoxylate reductase
MKVVLTRRLFDETVRLLETAGLEVHANRDDEPWGPARLRDELRGAAAVMPLLGDRIDAAAMDAAPGLEVIANVAVGFDNIDVPEATSRGIVVTNTPDVLTETTADLTMALILAAARRLPEADAWLRAGRFAGWEIAPALMGTDVHGRTLGIVGMGRIGTAVARRAALGFGMRVLYVSRRPRPEAERQIGARRASLDEALAESDFLSLHVPLTPETRGMLTLRELRRMKPGAILINTARGPLVREEDLARALEEGPLRGAALDVFEDEPRVHPALLRRRESVVLIPHLGSATAETRRRMAAAAAAEVIAVLRGDRPANPVNPEVLRDL